jgi:3-oxoacyl-[acyl-carrier protein] reductase
MAESSRGMDNVVVTGSSRGLGLAIAERLACDGFRVVAVARRHSEALAATTAKLAEHGTGALVFHPLDLTDVAAIPSFVRELRAQIGPIYGLVNNAGLGTAGILANMPDAQIEALIRLNTLSPIVMSKYVVRGMMAEGRGRVINVSSIVASTGFNALSVYAATKASLVGFTKSLAREVGRVGVTVNAIAPGFIDTEMTRELEESERDRVIGRSALRRLAAPEDIAAMAAFLMGEGGRNITGAVVTVDAGGTA